MNEVERAVVLFESLAKERDKRLKDTERDSEHHDSLTPVSASEMAQVVSTSVADDQAERRLFPTDAKRREFLKEYPEVAGALIKMEETSRQIAAAYNGREADDQVVAKRPTIIGSRTRRVFDRLW
jgi:hypothetical protein